jgi:DNA-binding IclR family transcriptional regulator
MQLTSRKAKMAQRVIEIFEYFGEGHSTITVMDVVRRFGRPQSSTSELLGGLVQMGFLYRDSHGRTYWPTPRLAAMGTGTQGGVLRDGRLFASMADLSQSTRLSVALFGRVGAHVQVFHWSPARRGEASTIQRGSSDLLSSSAAGHLLLTAIEDDMGRMLHRLNSEAPPHEKFNPRDLEALVSQYGQQGHATGPSGFGQSGLITAMLLPRRHAERPLALGFFYARKASTDPFALLATLGRSLAACLSDQPAAESTPRMIAV